METPTLDETPRESVDNRPSRARAFLPRGMADRDVTGARSGPLGAITSSPPGASDGGAPAASTGGAAAAPVAGIRRGDSGALSALRSTSGSGSAAATGVGTWPTLSIPDGAEGGGGHDGGGGDGIGGGGSGRGDDGDTPGSGDGGVGGHGGGGGGVGGGGGGAGPLRRGMSSFLRSDSSMRRTETGRARLMNKLTASPRPPPGPGDWAALDLARQMTAERLRDGGGDALLDVGDPDKESAKAADEEAKAEAKAAKEKKELQKKIKDYMKTGKWRGRQEPGGRGPLLICPRVA